jgi:EmrB/QacA subfamily drug resistance transporter
MPESPQTKRPLVLASVMLAMFMVAIEATIIATAMPAIVAKLGGFSLYTWVFSGFLLTQAATTILFGKLADLYGRRPVLIAGIVMFLIASILCGLAWSMPALIAFRLLQGLGAGSIAPITMTIVGDLYSPAERASIQGYLSSVWGISAIIGPLTGGLIVERFSWPWVFWMNVPIGIATIIMLSLFLHESVERKKHSIDYLGAFFFTVGVSSLLLLLTSPGGKVQAAVLALLFLISIPLFFWQERRAPEPMLAIDLWTDRLIASVNGACLAAGMTLIGLTTFLAVYVQGVMGYSATIAGLTLTMMAVGWPVSSVLSRRFYGWIGMQNTLRLGSLMMIAGALVFPFLGPSSSPIMAGTGSLIMGFGMGLLNITCILYIQGSVDWKRRGSATASNVFSRNLGSTFGAAALGGVLNLGLHQAGANVNADDIRKLLGEGAIDPSQKEVLQVALNGALHWTFWGMVGLSALTFILALLIPARQMHDLNPAGN